jgi:sugar lactone lactonase YvrE
MMRSAFRCACLAWALLHTPVADAQTISAYAGTGTAGYNGESPTRTALTAQLRFPIGLALDSAGNLYFVDGDNYRVRKVTPANTISTIFGSGIRGGALDQIALGRAVAIDGASGDIYISDSENHHVLRLPGGTGPAVVFAGTSGTPGMGANGVAATASALSEPSGLAVDSSGNVFIADTGNNRIRKVTGGIVNDVSGPPSSFTCAPATLYRPWGIALDASGDLYIAEPFNHRVMRLSGGVLSVFAGVTCSTGSDDDKLNSPMGVSVTSQGDVLITDSGYCKIKRVRAGVMTTIVGAGPPCGNTGDGGPPLLATLFNPWSVVADPANGNVLYVADSGNNRIRKVALPTSQPGQPAHFKNIAARGLVGTGNDVMIAGFILEGTESQTVAIVANGPSLVSTGIANPLANPAITLVRSADRAVIATNDNWQTDTNAAALLASGFAPSNALESGLYITLPPGAYTTIVSGVGGGTGVALISVFRVN